MRPVPFPPLYVPRAGDSDEAKEQDEKLWDDPKGWNLLVICRNGEWLVHQDILERVAPGFFEIAMKRATTNGTTKDEIEVLTLDLSEWHPATIGSLLNFLYVRDWKDMDVYPPSPTNLRSLRFHLDMVAQAWALNFPTTVREAAVAKINLATFQLNNVIVTGPDNNRPGLGFCNSIEEPLYRSIDFLYRQEGSELMRYLMPVCAAIARLLDVAVPWLLKHPDFTPRFQTLWSAYPIYDRYMGDHHKFLELGCLLPSWDDPPTSADPGTGNVSAGNRVPEGTPEEK